MKKRYIFNNSDPGFTKVKNNKNKWRDKKIIFTKHLCPILLSKNRFEKLNVSFNDEIDVRFITKDPKKPIYKNIKTKSRDLIPNIKICKGTQTPTNNVSPIESINKFESNENSTDKMNLPNPKSALPFVKVKLGLANQKLKPCFILADTGATHSILNFETFVKIPQYKSLILPEKAQATIITASNEEVKSIHKARVPFTFKDQLGHQHTIHHIVLVVKNLNHCGYIGNDILSNDSIIKGFFPTYFNLIEPKRRMKVIKIPISQINSSKTISLSAVSDTYLAPHSCQTINVQPISEVPYSIQLVIDEPECQNDLEKPDFSIIPSVQSKQDDDIYTIFINNNSNKYLHISPNTTLAEMTPQKESLNFLQVQSFSDLAQESHESDQSLKMFEVIPCRRHSRIDKIVQYPRLNSLQTTKSNETCSTENNHELSRIETLKNYTEKQLRKDENLTENEKKELLKKLDKDGFFAFPPTSLMEKHTNIFTEIKENSPELTEDQIINKIEIDHIDKQFHSQIKEMLHSNFEIFSKSEFDVKTCPLIELDVELKDEMKNVCLNCRYIPIPMGVRESAQKAIEDMVKADIITPIDKASPIISNILITKKKSGKPRFCLDLRLINHATKKLPCVVTPLQEVFQNFSRNRHHSTLDISNSFFSIPIKENKIPLFSFFDTKRRRYAFKKAPMGYKNSPYFLSAALNKTLQDFANVAIYLDDIVLSTNGTISEHITMVGEILEKLQKANFKIKAEKVQLLKPNLEVLGFCFDGQKFKIPTAKAQAFKEFPVPNTQKKLKSFICAASYFRRLIPRFADKTFTMQGLLKTDHRKFSFTKEALDDFYKLREELSNSAGFYPADPTRTLYMSSDASKNCSSFLLWDKSDTGEERYIAASSRLFTVAERNYSTFKKELVSVLAGLSAFDNILRFSKNLILYVDARSILFLRAAKSSSPMLMRFALAMSCYDLTVVHVPGKEHILPDILSRSLQPQTEADIDPMSELEAKTLLEQLTIPNGFEINKDLLKKYLLDDGLPSLSKKKQKKIKTKAQISDKTFKPELKAERKIKMPQCTPIHPFYRNQLRDLNREKPDFSTKNSLLNAITISDGENTNLDNFKLNSKIITDGQITIDLFRESQKSDEFCKSISIKDALPKEFLMRKGILIKIVNSVEKLVLPKAIFNILVNNLHFSTDGRHSSQTNMLEQIKETYFFPNLAKSLKEITDGCVLCFTMKTSNQKQQKFGKKKYAKTPRQEYCFDIAGGFPNSFGYKYIFIFVDTFSMYCILVPAKNRESQTIKKAFRDSIITPFMKPKRLYGDNEKSLFSKEMSDYCKENDISLSSCAPHSPWSNGLAEKTVHLAKDTLRLYTAQLPNASWSQLLANATNALNKRQLKTGFTPEKLFFGQVLNEDTLFSINTQCRDDKEYINKLSKEIEENKISHIHKRAKNSFCSRSNLNKTRKEHIFKKGQIVTLRDFSIAQIEGGALKQKYLGPFEILEIDQTRHACKLQNINNGYIRRAHLTHLRQFNPSLTANEFTKIPAQNEAKTILKGNQHSYNLRNKRS